MNFEFLPTPLNITITRVQESAAELTVGPSDRLGEFEVTSPQYPDLSAQSWKPTEAVNTLLYEALYAQPLARAVADALRGVGCTADEVAAWDNATEHCRDLAFRHDADSALVALAEYTSVGLPIMIAIGFIERLSPDEASEVYAAGGTPEDVISYEDLSATDKWWKWDFDIMPWLLAGFPYDRGRLYARECPVDEAVAWEAVVTAYSISDDDLCGSLRLGVTPQMMASGFPVHRAAFYADCLASPQAAAEWEAVLREHPVDDEDLRWIVRAGFEPATVTEHVGMDDDLGRTLAAAARALLSLNSAPQQGRVVDPWGTPSADPWGSPSAGGDIPPF